MTTKTLVYIPMIMKIGTNHNENMQTNNLAHISKKWENVKFNTDEGLTKLWKSLKGIDIE